MNKAWWVFHLNLALSSTLHSRGENKVIYPSPTELLLTLLSGMFDLHPIKTKLFNGKPPFNWEAFLFYAVISFSLSGIKTPRATMAAPPITVNNIRCEKINSAISGLKGPTDTVRISSMIQAVAMV